MAIFDPDRVLGKMSKMPIFSRKCHIFGQNGSILGPFGQKTDLSPGSSRSAWNVRPEARIDGVSETIRFSYASEASVIPARLRAAAKSP